MFFSCFIWIIRQKSQEKKTQSTPYAFQRSNPDKA